MVFVDLNTGDLVGTDITGSQRVASAEHVESFDIEFVDRLTLVFDSSTGLDGDAGQLAQNIFYGAIGRSDERSHVVVKRIAVRTDGRGFDRYFFQFESRRSKRLVDRGRLRRYTPADGAIAQYGELQLNRLLLLCQR